MNIIKTFLGVLVLVLIIILVLFVLNKTGTLTYNSTDSWINNIFEQAKSWWLGNITPWWNENINTTS